MNINKILTVLVIGIALVGLTGAASASIHTETSVWGTHITSESKLVVRNMPVTEIYQSMLVAEFKYPIFPPVDLSYTEKEISGDTFAEVNKVVSTPTGSRTTTILRGLPQITGSLLEYTCVDMGTGGGARVYKFPQEKESATFGWHSGHPAASAYPASLTQSTSIYWP